jgi:hypothetical protein
MRTGGMLLASLAALMLARLGEVASAHSRPHAALIGLLAAVGKRPHAALIGLLTSPCVYEQRRPEPNGFPINLAVRDYRADVLVALLPRH